MNDEYLMQMNRVSLREALLKQAFEIAATSGTCVYYNQVIAIAEELEKFVYNGLEPAK